MAPRAEELCKEVSVLTDYQPNFAIRIFVPTGHHGANCVIYQRDHVQVEFLQRDGVVGVTPGGHSLTPPLPHCLLSLGVLQAPTVFPQPHVSAGGRSNLDTQLQRSWASPARNSPQGRSAGWSD